MLLTICSALRKYVISSFEVLIEIWCCYHRVPLSASASSRLLRCSSKSNVAKTVFRSQIVGDLVFWDVHRNLMLLLPCSALRKCVILSFEVLIRIWCCYHHVPLSACAWSGLFRCSSKSDVATDMFRSQEVRDLVLWGAHRNLMLLPPFSVVSECVMSSFEVLIEIWCCYDSSVLRLCVISFSEVLIEIWCCYECVPLSDCAWFRLLRSSSKSDVAITMFHSQRVRHLVFSGAHPHLILLRMCSTLRLCVIASFEVLMESWSCYHPLLFSGSAWSLLFMCSSKSDVATTVFPPQDVRYLLFWYAYGSFKIFHARWCAMLSLHVLTHIW